MLEKKIGHLVSPMDKKDSLSLNLHPKEANDVHSEYSKLFPLPASPYSSYRGLRILAIDEVSIRKCHRYLTAVLDNETGRVVWVGEARKARSLRKFFSGMSRQQRQKLEAVVRAFRPEQGHEHGPNPPEGPWLQ